MHKKMSVPQTPCIRMASSLALHVLSCSADSRSIIDIRANLEPTNLTGKSKNPSICNKRVC